MTRVSLGGQVASVPKDRVMAVTTVSGTTASTTTVTASATRTNPCSTRSPFASNFRLCGAL